MGIADGYLNQINEFYPFLGRLNNFRGKFPFRRNKRHIARVGFPREGVNLNIDFLPRLDLADFRFINEDFQINAGQIGNGNDFPAGRYRG